MIATIYYSILNLMYSEILLRSPRLNQLGAPNAWHWAWYVSNLVASQPVITKSQLCLFLYLFLFMVLVVVIIPCN